MAAEKKHAGLLVKLLELQKTAKAFKKDKQAFNYQYVTGDKILTVLRPKMDELGLLLIPSVKTFETERVTYPVWDAKSKTMTEKMEILAKITVDFTWYDAETGDSLTQTWAGSGMNTFDKGYGSALTYAERYFLLKTFHLATDRDDVDAIATERDKVIAETEQAASDARAASAAVLQPAPEKPVQKQLRKVVKGDPLIENILAWTRKQPDQDAAIAKALKGYDWDDDALNDYIYRAQADNKFLRELQEGGDQ